jgi:hypothetical protein
LRIVILVGVILAVGSLVGCATPEPPRVIEVPSSKPYRFIQWSRADTPETVQQVKRHNRTHQAVKDAEKKARQ